MAGLLAAGPPRAGTALPASGVRTVAADFCGGDKIAYPAHWCSPSSLPLGYRMPTRMRRASASECERGAFARWQPSPRRIPIMITVKITATVQARIPTPARIVSGDIGLLSARLIAVIVTLADGVRPVVHLAGRPRDDVMLAVASLACRCSE